MINDEKGTVFSALIKNSIMADKQSGTGARGKQQKPKGQQAPEKGNHTKTSDNNRSAQIKQVNSSEKRQGSAR